MARKKQSVPMEAAEAQPPPAASSEIPVKVKPKRPKKSQLLQDWVHHRTAGQAHYRAADLLLDKLLRRSKVGGRIIHPDTGEQFVIVDNFADKNTAFRAVGVRRFELTPIKGTKRPVAALGEELPE